MKGKGIRQERETVINYNEADASASIWTASERVYRKLKKQGYEPVKDTERSATFEIPKKRVSIRKAISTSNKQLKALERARAKAKNLSSQDPLKLQGQNGEKASLAES